MGASSYVSLNWSTTMLTKSMLVWMVLFASEQTGYPVPPERVPTIEFVSDAEIDRIAETDAYAVYGWPENEVLYIPTSCEPMTTIECKSAVIHEIVHWLQDNAGEFDDINNIQCMATYEGEAYKTEDKFLGKYYNLSLENFGYSKEFILFLSTCRSAAYD